jgi:very-short-patch-repair endonuclease
MQDAPMTADARFHRLAVRQHGAVALAQALALGLSNRQVRHRLEAGRHVLLRPGVVAPAGAPPTWLQIAMAATLAAGEGAVLSHASAAALRDLSVRDGEQIEISNVRARQHRLAGITAHRFVVLEPDRTTYQGIPVTTVARTIVDLSGRLGADALGRLLDEALRRRLVTIDSVVECLGRLAPAPGRRPSVVERVLAQRGADFDPGHSAFESRVLRALAAGGLPRPVVQHRLTVAGRRYRIDLAYPSERIAIELDGYEHHAGRSAFDADRARGNDIVGEGYALLRFTWAMSDEAIVAAVAAALRRSRAA